MQNKKNGSEFEKSFDKKKKTLNKSNFRLLQKELEQNKKFTHTKKKFFFTIRLESLQNNEEYQ